METIEQSVKDCIEEQLKSGIIEKVLTQKLEECISNSLDELFKWNGSLKKAIDEKIESTIAPYLSSYDYSNYIVKLDSVLANLLKNLTLDNRKILENFQGLVSSEEIKEIKLSKIFEKWCDYCAKEIDKDKIDNYDYEGGYINCEMQVDTEQPSYSCFEYAEVEFSCEEDKNLNFKFRMYRYGEGNYNLSSIDRDIRSIRQLNEIEILMMRLEQVYKPIIVDEDCLADEVFVGYEPE